MPYFTKSISLPKGNTARGETIENEFTAVETGFGTVESDISKTVRFSSSVNSIAASAADRANKVVAYNSMGEPYLASLLSGPTIVTINTKNLIINGNFDIWQRATSVSGASTGYQSVDRWRTSIFGDTFDILRSSFSLGQTDVPNNPVYYMRNTVTTSSLTDSLSSIRQRIEDVRTLSNSTCTLSFWAKADASRNIAVEFAQSFGTGGSPSSPVTGISVTTLNLGTSWQKFTVTASIPSILGKTEGTNSDSYFQVTFWFSAGSDYNSRTNSLGTQSGVFDIAQVQLEKGSDATGFELRPQQAELALCQRYYEKSYNLGVVPGTSTTAGSRSGSLARATAALEPLQSDFRVEKRAAPTMTWYSPDNGTSANAYNVTDAGDVSISGTSLTGTTTTGYPNTSVSQTDGDSLRVHWTADSEL